MLRRKGIRVVSITEHADDSPTGKLMEAIIESVDEFYSENLAQEVVRGMRESASRGFFLGSKAPFGYNRVKVSDGVKDRPHPGGGPGRGPHCHRNLREFPAGQRAEGNLQGAERAGHHPQGTPLAEERHPLPADQRGLTPAPPSGG